MQRIIKAILFTLVYFNLNAISSQTPNSAFLKSCGLISLLQEDSSVSMQNASLFNKGILLAYNNQYGFSDVPIVLSALSIPKNSVRISLGNQYLGDEIYSENCSYLNLSHQEKNLSIGSTVQLIYQKISGYEVLHFQTIDTGITFRHKNYTSTIYTKNLVQFGSKTLELYKGLYLESMLSYKNRIKLGIGLSKEEQYPLNYQYGSKLMISPLLSFSTGYQTQNKELSYSAEFNMNQYHLNYCVSFHPYLPASHAIAIQYKWD